MSNFKLTVTIPLKTYLIKFIAKNHSIDPFILSKGKCHISSLILDPLKKEGSIRPPLKPEIGNYADLVCLIPNGDTRYFFDQSSVLRINQRLDSMFDQQLCDMVSITNERKGDINQRIQQFVDFYNISEDDLAMPTIIKMYYRARYQKDPIERERKIKDEIERWKQMKLFEN